MERNKKKIAKSENQYIGAALGRHDMFLCPGWGNDPSHKHPIEHAEIDHINPNGPNTINNLQLMCHKHNREKGKSKSNEEDKPSNVSLKDKKIDDIGGRLT